MDENQAIPSQDSASQAPPQDTQQQQFQQDVPPQQQVPPQYQQQMPPPYQQPAYVVAESPKNVGLAVALAFLFGPIGLLYASVKLGLVTFLVSFVIGVIIGVIAAFTFGIGILLLIPFWLIQGIICGWLAYVETKKYNNNLQAGIYGGAYPAPAAYPQQYAQVPANNVAQGGQPYQVPPQGDASQYVPDFSQIESAGQDAINNIKPAVSKIAGDVQQKSHEAMEAMKPKLEEFGAKTQEAAHEMKEKALPFLARMKANLQEGAAQLKEIITTSDRKKLGLLGGALALLVVLGIGGYYAHEQWPTWQYEYNAYKYVSIVGDCGSIAEKIGKLDADYDDTKVAKMIKELKENIEKLRKLNGEIQKTSALQVVKPYRVIHHRLIASIDAEIMLLNSYVQRLEEPAKEHGYLKPMRQMRLARNHGYTINHVDLLKLDKIDMTFESTANHFKKTYLEHKSRPAKPANAADKAKAKDKAPANNKFVNFNNRKSGVGSKKQEQIAEKLKNLKEVIFIPESVALDGNDVVISGYFTNRCDYRVTGVKQLLLDVELFDGDKSVYKLTNHPIANIEISSKEMKPGENGVATLRVTGQQNLPQTINDYCVWAHKIQWVRGK